MLFLCFTIALVLFATVATSAADEPQVRPTGPLVLKITSKKDHYLFVGDGKSTKEYRADLEAMAKSQENGERIHPPKALPVDLVMVLENTSRENVTVYVNGTANTHTFDLTGGAGVVTLKNTAAMPQFIRLPTAVTIEPGKSHEMPITTLADGRRGNARLIYWTGPGEYTLVAKYTLVDQKGIKQSELESEPITISVTAK
jgi:hypothetical protein